MTTSEVKLVKLFVQNFAEKARENDQVPIVYIINNLGTGDHLYQLLLPTLQKDQIPYLSSHKIVPPNDAKYFTDLPIY